MAIAYRLDASLGLTLTVFDGRITADEWQTAVRAIFSDPAWPPGPLNLADLTTAYADGLTADDRAEILALNGVGADYLAEMRSAAVGRRGGEKTPVFEPTDHEASLGLALFDDLATACSWLGLEPDTADRMIARLRLQMRSPETTNSEPFQNLLLGDHVHQAAGMVAVQADCEVGEAIRRMKARALSTHEPIEYLALDVLDGLVRFD